MCLVWFSNPTNVRFPCFHPFALLHVSLAVTSCIWCESPNYWGQRAAVRTMVHWHFHAWRFVSNQTGQNGPNSLFCLCHLCNSTTYLSRIKWCFIEFPLPGKPLGCPSRQNKQNFTTKWLHKFAGSFVCFIAWYVDCTTLLFRGIRLYFCSMSSH